MVARLRMQQRLLVKQLSQCDAFLVSVLLVGASLTAKTPTVAEEPKKDDKPAEAVALSAEDYSENEAECTETSNDGTTAVYACKAKGFEGVNEATVTIDVAQEDSCILCSY